MYSESEGGAQYEAEASCHGYESQEAKHIKLHMFADVDLPSIAKSPSGVNYWRWGSIHNDLAVDHIYGKSQLQPHGSKT